MLEKKAFLYFNFIIQLISIFLLYFVLYYTDGYNFYQQFYFKFIENKNKEWPRKRYLESKQKKQNKEYLFTKSLFFLISTAWSGQYPAGPFFVPTNHTAKSQKKKRFRQNQSVISYYLLFFCFFFFFFFIYLIDFYWILEKGKNGTMDFCTMHFMLWLKLFCRAVSVKIPSSSRTNFFLFSFQLFNFVF